MWNFISFREAIIYVVILMLKSTLFSFLCFTSMGSKKIRLSLLTTASAIQDQTQAAVVFPQSCSRSQKSVLQNIFKEEKLQGN